MSVRRVVTARNAEGRSVVVSDGASPREKVLTHLPGFVAAPLWTSTGTPGLAHDGRDPMEAGGSLLPAPGGSAFLVVTFAPDSVMAAPDFRPDLAFAEHAAAAPGIAETFEPDHPGMHTTPTLDYGVVLAGCVVLELDDGATVGLGPGDTFVQHATRHAWRNPHTEPATIAFTMLGARE